VPYTSGTLTVSSCLPLTVLTARRHAQLAVDADPRWRDLFAIEPLLRASNTPLVRELTLAEDEEVQVRLAVALAPGAPRRLPLAASQYLASRSDHAATLGHVVIRTRHPNPAAAAAALAAAGLAAAPAPAATPTLTTREGAGEPVPEGSDSTAEPLVVERRVPIVMPITEPPLFAVIPSHIEFDSLALETFMDGDAGSAPTGRQSAETAPPEDTAAGAPFSASESPLSAVSEGLPAHSHRASSATDRAAARTLQKTHSATSVVLPPPVASASASAGAGAAAALRERGHAAAPTGVAAFDAQDARGRDRAASFSQVGQAAAAAGAHTEPNTPPRAASRAYAGSEEPSSPLDAIAGRVARRDSGPDYPLLSPATASAQAFRSVPMSPVDGDGAARSGPYPHAPRDGEAQSAPFTGAAATPTAATLVELFERLRMLRHQRRDVVLRNLSTEVDLQLEVCSGSGPTAGNGGVLGGSLTRTPATARRLLVQISLVTPPGFPPDVIRLVPTLTARCVKACVLRRRRCVGARAKLTTTQSRLGWAAPPGIR